MQQDDQLPPNPQGHQTRSFRNDGSGLPPFESDMMELEGKLGRRFAKKLSFFEWTPTMVIVAIFVGSFITGILFTSAILTGMIEIQPSVIKGFLKSILGKS